MGKWGIAFRIGSGFAFRSFWLSEPRFTYADFTPRNISVIDSHVKLNRMSRTNRDAVTAGKPYRPVLWQQARMFSEWNPRAMVFEDLDLPATDDFVLTPWNVSMDYSNRIDFPNWEASRTQKFYGVAGSIEETKMSENTDTGFRPEVIGRAISTAPGHPVEPASLGWIWVKVLAYSTNALINSRTTITLGTFVSGILAANYSGSGRANSDSWQVIADFDELRMVSPGTFPDNGSYDWTEWVVGWTLTLGGSPYAADAPDGNRITGVRINPPEADPFLFLRTRRASLNADPGRIPRGVTFDMTNSTYARPRRRSASRTRGRSASRPRRGLVLKGGPRQSRTFSFLAVPPLWKD